MVIAWEAMANSRRESTDFLPRGRRILLRSSSVIRLKADLAFLGASCSDRVGFVGQPICAGADSETVRCATSS